MYVYRFLLHYMKSDEWTNFTQRLNDPKVDFAGKDKNELIRLWVSYRGQTLARTGRLKFELWATTVFVVVDKLEMKARIQVTANGHHSSFGLLSSGPNHPKTINPDWQTVVSH